MKIKGVTGGKGRGNPVEFTPEEKPEVMLKVSVPQAAPAGQQWWVESSTISKLHHTPLGVKSVKSSQKNFSTKSYVVDGEVTIRALQVAGDKYLPALKKNYHIEFEDIVDDMGMPDMKVTAFELT